MRKSEYDAHRHLRDAKPVGRGAWPKQAPRYGTSRVVLVLALVLLVLFVLGAMGVRDNTLELEQAHYCRMVASFKQNPNVGWPDYAESFKTECNEDGTVKGTR